ncbi:MAG: DUF4007 family protein [Firmicutes bacterium]|nr:DUF4007 family protein [Bacillota bacterium]MCL1954123.1 DUF4007 family protein [Bacillota bacterium]
MINIKDKIDCDNNDSIFKISIRKHESFEIRRGWLHKGIRYVDSGNSFSDKDSDKNVGDKLGIGRSMVKALRYWLKAAKLIIDKNNKQYLTSIGKIINEKDTYFEEKGTNYLIHYLLASNCDDATAWYWFFNVYKELYIDKETFVEEFIEFIGQQKSKRIIEDEYNCIIKSYSHKSIDSIDPEETKICPLSELNLIQSLDNKGKIYKKTSPNIDDVHPMIAYAVVMDQLNDESKITKFTNKKNNITQLEINKLWKDENSIGKIFNLDRISIFRIIEKLENIGVIDIVRTAGLDIINIKKQMTLEQCLEEYYKMILEASHG